MGERRGTFRFGCGGGGGGGSGTGSWGRGGSALGEIVERSKVLGHCVGPGEGFAAAWGVSGVRARRASQPFGGGGPQVSKGVSYPRAASTAMKEGHMETKASRIVRAAKRAPLRQRRGGGRWKMMGLKSQVLG